MRQTLRLRCLVNSQKPGSFPPSQVPSIRSISTALFHNHHYRHHQYQQRHATISALTSQQPRRPSSRPLNLCRNLKNFTKTRPFFSSLFNNNDNNDKNNTNNNARTLTATRTLPYPPEPLYRVISSVELYSEFLPFLSESTVTARDEKTGYPTRAYLTIGYGPFSETFTSRVDCNKGNWVVEARSGERFVSSTSSSFSIFPGANEEVFEYLSTKWELIPVSFSTASSTAPVQGQGQSQTKVNLEIRFAFKNALHAALMSAMEGQMAGVMVEAFEKRVKEVEGEK